MKFLPVKVCGTPVPKSTFIPIVNINDAFYDVKCPSVRSGVTAEYYFAASIDAERAVYSLVMPVVLCKGSDDASAATPMVIAISVPKGATLVTAADNTPVSPALPLMEIRTAFLDGFTRKLDDGRSQYAFTNVDTTPLEEIASKYAIADATADKWYAMKSSGKTGGVCVGPDSIADALMDMQRPEFADYRQIVLTDDPSLLADMQTVQFADGTDAAAFTGDSPAEPEAPAYVAPANARRLYLSTDMKRTYHDPSYFEVFVRGRKVNVDRDFTINVASYDIGDLEIKYRGDDYEVVGCRSVDPELRLAMKPIAKEVPTPVYDYEYDEEPSRKRPAWIMLSIGIMLGILIGFGIAILGVLLHDSTSAPAQTDAAPADTVKIAPAPVDTTAVKAPETTDTVPAAAEPTAAQDAQRNIKPRSRRSATAAAAPAGAPASASPSPAAKSDIDILAPVTTAAPAKPSLDPTAERPLPPNR